jgi:hypothetical protein
VDPNFFFFFSVPDPCLALISDPVPDSNPAFSFKMWQTLLNFKI